MDARKTNFEELARHLAEAETDLIGPRHRQLSTEGIGRRQAEEALRQSEARYRMLFEAMTEGFCLNEMIFDESGRPYDLRCLAVNPAFELQTGLKAADILGRTARELFPDAEPVWLERYGDVVLTGEAAHFEEWFGPLKRCFAVSAFRTEPGRFAAVFSDVTDRKCADEMLRANEEALRQLNEELDKKVRQRTAELEAANAELRREILERKQAEARLAKAQELAEQRALELEATYRTAPVGLAVLDRELRYVQVNERLAEINGVPVADHIGRTIREIVPTLEEQALSALCRIFETKEPLLDIEFRGETPAQPGVERIWNENWFPLQNQKGEITGMNVVVEEITERRKAENELKASHQALTARAEQLRVLTGELTLAEQRERRRVVMLIHDHLQQLLVGAKFRTSILCLAGDKVIRESANEIEGLLNESIRVTRSLTAELSPPILHEGGLIAGLEWLARWMADTHGLVLDLSVEAITRPIGDDIKIFLFESVRELLFNAVKHSQVRSAKVSLRIVEGRLQIIVTDQGIGFEPESIKRAGQQGGGLGLFSIRERLILFGGKMEIHSAPGKGSQFILTVPLGQARPAPFVAASGSESAGDSLAVGPSSHLAGDMIRVLLADDHAVMRESLARMLSAEPDLAIIGKACGGAEAVDLARKLLPDVMLVDVSMPGLSGVELTRIIHNWRPEIRIIGLSMFDEPERARAMRDAGAVDYLTKGGAFTDLVAAIRQCRGKPCEPPSSDTSPTAKPAVKRPRRKG